MKRLYLAVAVGAALLASACTTTGTPWPADPGGPVASCAGSTLDEKTLASAELAFNTAGKLYVAADNAGLMNDDLKAKLKPMFGDAFVALRLARDARSACNAATLAAQARIALDIATKIQPLIPKKE